MESFKGKTDTQVQGTNDRATLSKLSTVRLGYYEDRFLQCFVSKASRRAPIIHRSYYIRAKAIHFMVKGFLQSLNFKNLQKQIVSLGAGFDTLFFTLAIDGLLKDTKYFEVDFPEVVKQKSSLILQNKELSQVLGTITAEKEQWLGGGMNSAKYSLLGCNLKNRSMLESCLLKCGLNTSSPTLLLSEVVLTYMDPPQSSTDIIGWAAHFFSSAIFVMFEQVNPNDAFGIKMMNHFRQSVGAPLHATEAFPTRQSQIQRFTKEGWPLVKCPTLNFIYYDTLPAEEKARVEEIEPFDEFEEWHLMCSHYIILTAFKGPCQNLQKELFRLQNAKDFPDRSQNTEDTPCNIYPVDVLPSTDGVKRFGHTATPLSDGSVLLIGGFGLRRGKHMRLNGVQLLQSVQDTWHCTEVTEGDGILDGRMFHSATRLSNNDVLIYGGRTSPSKPCVETLLLSLTKEVQTDRDSSYCTNCTSCCLLETAESKYNKDSQCFCSETECKDKEDVQGSPLNNEHKVSDYGQSCRIVKQGCKRSVLNCQGEIPEPRWRHTATRIFLPDGSENVLVFGGRTSTRLALGDCFLFHSKSQTWTKVFLSGDPISPRHSHTACVWNYSVVVAGGLDANLHALNMVQIIDTQVSPMVVWTLQVEPPLLPRYSHTAHIVDDELILVGGVTPNSPHPPGIVILDLKSVAWKSLIPPASTTPSTPLMLHNHCSVWEGSQGIMVLGGGGNCFSFGTHLNDRPILINLPLI